MRLGKFVWVTALTLAALCSGCASESYRAGYQRGLGLQRWTFTATLAALIEIQTGQVDSATPRLELLCYTSYLMLVEDARYKDSPLVKKLTPDLIAYRRKTAKPETEWNSIEKRLEKALAEYREH